MSQTYEDLKFLDAKKNLTRQATKVLHDIVQAYQTGIFDDPKLSATYCGLLACICEGKVQGVFDEESGSVKWSLTPEYSAQVEALREAILNAGLGTENIVKGPWPQ